MIDDGINPLCRVILVLSARESADGTEKYGKGNVWNKMMRTDEYGLDVGGFVFVFHIVESRQNRLLQCLFVVGSMPLRFLVIRGHSTSYMCLESVPSVQIGEKILRYGQLIVPLHG